jgi:hypothetical protein
MLYSYANMDHQQKMLMRDGFNKYMDNLNIYRCDNKQVYIIVQDHTKYIIKYSKGICLTELFEKIPHEWKLLEKKDLISIYFEEI